LGAFAFTGSGVVPDSGVATTLGAGFVGSPATGVTSAETELRVPTVSCAHQNDDEDLWLGIQAFHEADGVRPDDLFAQVKASCDVGVVSYTGFVDAGGTIASLPVKPGDLVATFVRESSTGSVAQLNDLTSGPGISAVGGPLSDFSVLEGQQDLTSVVPTFFDAATGTNEIFFLNSFVNGFRQRFDGFPTSQITEKNNHLEINTSNLTLNQSAFHLTFKSHF
jgi:hypothetical protein